MKHDTNSDDDDGPDGAAAAATTTNTDSRKGNFEFPDRAVDLIGLMLDPDIRAARDRVHAQIENGLIQNGGIGGGSVANGRPMTQGAETLAKAVVSIQAIQKQAQRDRHRNRK